MMIKNDKQFHATSAKLNALQEAFDASKGEDQELYRRLIDAATVELHEYRAIKSGARSDFFIGSLDALGHALIKARVARGLTHRQLADLLDVSEQMVQRDEARDYENAGLARLADILDVLDYELVGHVKPRTRPVMPLRSFAAGAEAQSTNLRVDVAWDGGERDALCARGGASQ